MKGKNFFYRINPESVLSEMTSIDHSEWLQWFLNFFHDLRNDDPANAKTQLASNIILEAHNFRSKRAVAGKASAEQRATKEQHKSTNVEHMLNNAQPVAVAVAVAVTKEESKDREKSCRFTPPTVEEVGVYCLERSNGVNPHKWHDHYSAKGWMVGRTKMKDWRAAVRTWEGDRQVPAAKNNTRLDRNIEAARQAGMMLGVFDEEA